MDKNISQQVRKEIEQYKLEIQNTELKAEIQAANDALVLQKQHTEHLYSSMTWVIGIIGLVVAVAGIAIPIWNAYQSQEMKKELQEIKTNVDDFIENKFVEWERKDIDRVLNAFLDGTIDVNGYKAALRLKQPPLEHLEKIFDKLFSKFDSKTELKETALVGGANVSQFFSYIFVDLDDTNNEDLQTIKNKIVNSEWFLPILSQINPIRSKVGGKMFGWFYAVQGKQKIIDMLSNIDKGSEQPRNFWNLVRMVQSESFNIDNESKVEIYKTIAQRILSEKTSISSVTMVQNNKLIIDKLDDNGILDKASIEDLNHSELASFGIEGLGFTHIKKDSYLAQKIRERKN